MQKDRLVDLDALRGFALFGIHMVNIAYFATPYQQLLTDDPQFSSGLDEFARIAVSILFEGKFYVLFSFLFGYSFTLQARAAERDGADFYARILRRSLGLWLIGLAHALLLFSGDILTTYALLSLVLLAVMNKRDRTLALSAAWLIAIIVFIWGGLGLAAAWFGGFDPADLVEQARAIQNAYTATAASVVSRLSEEFLPSLYVCVLAQAPVALAMFFLGNIAARRQLLSRVDEHRALFKFLATIGLAVGLPSAILYGLWYNAQDHSWAGIAFTLSLPTAPFLSAGYLATLVLVFQHPYGRKLRDALAPAGRMALSNYLLQSLICAVIFYAYGFRLMGHVSPPAVVLIAIAIFTTQLVVSAWWMRRFAYGPAEWLLRAITYATWPPWRRAILPGNPVG